MISFNKGTEHLYQFEAVGPGPGRGTTPAGGINERTGDEGNEPRPVTFARTCLRSFVDIAVTLERVRHIPKRALLLVRERDTLCVCGTARQRKRPFVCDMSSASPPK